MSASAIHPAEEVELPHVQVLKFCDPPSEKGQLVQFRLIYRGRLPAQKSGGGGSRVAEKHEIRKQFHLQLAELWKEHPLLVAWNRSTESSQTGDGPRSTRTLTDTYADQYENFGFRWMPLINNQYGLACALDILFLRRDNPGNLIKSGGDIDNRIKVLVDAMQVPKYKQDILDFKPEAHENPFYCLLEEDSLVTDIRVQTDRLLIPQQSDEALHDVMLVVHVKTLVVNSRLAPTDFYT